MIKRIDFNLNTTSSSNKKPKKKTKNHQITTNKQAHNKPAIDCQLSTLELVDRDALWL
jgi:hypothetical protein